jgi:hypothetical protein
MLEGPQRLYMRGGVSVSWNEAPRSKLRGITELEPSELLEIFGGRFRIRKWPVRTRSSGREGSSIITHKQSVLVHCQQRRD